MSDTTFAVGDQVLSNVDAQGLKKGARYRVEEIDKLHTPFGTFVTYHVVQVAQLVTSGGASFSPYGSRIAVGNGHLVLRAAGGAL